MIECNLLSIRERKILQNVLLKKIYDVEIYTIEYNKDLKICAFIKMVFEDSNTLIVTTGKFADNILLLDEFRFLEERKKYDSQDNVETKVNHLSSSETFNVMKGKLLLEIFCIQKPDEEYYWQINFIFEKKSFIIHGLVDEVEFSIVENVSG
ncbi:MAG: hypothetical protein AAB221_04455 [Bacteroidota bacterium]